MTFALPSYYQSNSTDINRRTTEQDEFNRRVDEEFTLTAFFLNLFFGELGRFQTKDFLVIKTGNPTEDFRLRHAFGVIATDYAILNVQNNGGGSGSVDWPVRTASTIPTEDVDDTTFITLTLSGRGNYIIRVNFDTKIADELANIEGTS